MADAVVGAALFVNGAMAGFLRSWMARLCDEQARTDRIAASLSGGNGQERSVPLHQRGVQHASPGLPMDELPVDDAVVDNQAMTVRVGSIVMGASNVRRAMEFWGRALGYVPREEPEDTWVVLTPASGDGPNVSLGLSETPVQDRPRVHLDLYTSDQAAEVDRLLGLGASRVDWQDHPDDADFVVLADTEGNRFCVIDHR